MSLTKLEQEQLFFGSYEAAKDFVDSNPASTMEKSPSGAAWIIKGLPEPPKKYTEEEVKVPSFIKQKRKKKRLGEILKPKKKNK